MFICEFLGELQQKLLDYSTNKLMSKRKFDKILGSVAAILRGYVDGACVVGLMYCVIVPVTALKNIKKRS